eukprot:scaffold13611_cov141-Isochrysis_galbana.AAC.2
MPPKGVWEGPHVIFHFVNNDDVVPFPRAGPCAFLAKAAHVQIVILEPGVPSEAMVSVLKNREHARVEVGHVVVDPLSAEDDSQHGGPAAATASRRGSAPCESRGSARVRPSLCTSVCQL